MATQGINQKEYLKKYLSSSSDDKKKKKKRNKGKPNDERFRIIDDDIDLKNMRPLEDDEIELYSLAEDAPQIAGIIDERPDELRTLEEFGTKRWKVVADENGIDDIKVTAINHSVKPNSDDSRLNCAKQRQSPDISPVRKSRTRNSPSASSSSSPPRRKKSDISPKARDNSKVQKKPEVQTQDSRRKNVSESPLRKIKKEPDSDESPPRKSRKQESPPRKMEKHNNVSSSPGGRGRRYDDDDESPPRRPKRHDVSKSPAQKVKRNNDSDESPPRKLKQKRYDSDESPPRRSRRPDSNKSSPKRSKRDVDSDESPPRKYKRKAFSDESPSRKPQRPNESPSNKIRKKEDSDESPPRKPGRNEYDTQTKYSKSQMLSRSSHYTETSKRLDNHNHRQYNSSVRKSRFTDIDSSTSKDINKLGSSRGSDSDLSPSRKAQRPDSLKKNHISPRRESLHSSSGSGSRGGTKDYSISSKKHRNQSDSDESPPRKLGKHNDPDTRDKKSRSSRELTERTLDGRKAGLQDAKELRKEISEMKRNEREIFEKMDPSVSGKGAAPVMRDRKTGKRRDLEQEAKEKQEQDKKKAEHDSKYTRWGRGLKQVEEQAQRLQEDMYEMTKPLARYADDTDLDQHLREQEREGDPMLDYIRSKTSEPSSKKKPQYQGSFLPNRFGIRPGHRWDGVDRSSGYEKQWFETANAKKATEEEAYKWSTSDM